MKGYIDYLITLFPPKEVVDQVEQYKQQAANMIGVCDSPFIPANISIKAMPRRKPYMAAPEITGLKNNVKQLPPVTLSIDGFDFFSHGHEYRTLYAKIRSNAFTTQWFKSLKKSLNIKDYLVPHIAIARNIQKNDFDKLWPQFKKINWVEDFEMGKLTVLQREALNTFAKWEIFVELPFEARHLVNEVLPKPPSTKPLSGNYSASQQTSLF